MQEKDFNPAKFKELRRQAEAKLKQNRTGIPERLDTLTTEQVQRLLHKLQVYHAELEIQNEELLRAQLELETSRLHYFDLYELAPAGYLTLDGWGIIRQANLTAAKLLGVERDKLLGEPFSRFVAAEDQDSYYRQSRQVLQAGGQQAWEVRMIGKGGALFWVQVEMSSTRDRESGGAATQRLVIMDISGRKQAEAALRKAHDELERKVAERTKELAQANEKYRLLVDNTPDLIFSFDRELRHTFVNRSVCRLHGLEEREIIGRTHSELGYCEDAVQQLEDPFSQVLNGNTVEEEATVTMPNGAVRTFRFVAAPLCDEYGNVTGITGTGRDITEWKKMEQEMIKADKLEAIGTLAGGIAHDFNNYLAMLLTNVSLAKIYSNNEAKILEKLDGMEKAILRAKELSNHLFTFARGGAPFKQKIAIGQLIEENIRFTLSGSHVRSHFMLAEDLHMVEADAGQLSQVLNNIAINALQAMPEGGILEVRAENVALDDSSRPLPQGLCVKITLRDEGTGIPAKYLPKLFDPFFTTKDKGRGMGLATAYSIIKKHGGYLEVESEMGVGTSFSIFLPATAGAENIQAAGGEVLQGTGKILIMDDEEDLLNATGETLSALGYEVSLSRDGGQAIELYTRALEQNQPFDLVILDLTIPGGMGGKQAIQELLELDPGVKAVVASGYSNDPVMARYRDFGFKGIIKKPFSLEELSKTVKIIAGL